MSTPEKTTPPTQRIPDTNAFYDFKVGVRLLLPVEAGHIWKWRIDCADTDTTLSCGETHPDSTEPTNVRTFQQYFVRAKIGLWRQNIQTKQVETVFETIYDATGKKVLISMPEKTLGDTIAWLPYCIKFAEKHGCHVTVAMQEHIADLYRNSYPNITMISEKNISLKEHKSFYAEYRIGLFPTDENKRCQPKKYQSAGLGPVVGYILGVDPELKAPKIDPEIGKEYPKIEEPYVCIATQSTMQAKLWNNPQGWLDVVKFLKSHGFRVVCIDRDMKIERENFWNCIPHGCEDHTGNRPLAERVQALRNCSFFIGLSSGLSWLAWSTGADVLMISGFTHPTNEFHTPWRVHNPHVCNSCWNDEMIPFSKNSSFFWCPRQTKPEEKFQCSRAIGTPQVLKMIESMPAFQRDRRK